MRKGKEEPGAQTKPTLTAGVPRSGRRGESLSSLAHEKGRRKARTNRGPTPGEAGVGRRGGGRSSRVGELRRHRHRQRKEKCPLGRTVHDLTSLKLGVIQGRSGNDLQGIERNRGSEKTKSWKKKGNTLNLHEESTSTYV